MLQKMLPIFLCILIAVISINSTVFSRWSRPEILSLSTDRGINNETIHLTIKGDKFAKSVIVKLTRYDQLEIVADNVQVISKNEITCTVNLKGKAAGVWDITIVNMNRFLFFTYPKLVIFLKRFTIEYAVPVKTG